MNDTLEKLTDRIKELEMINAELEYQNMKLAKRVETLEDRLKRSIYIT